MRHGIGRVLYFIFVLCISLVPVYFHCCTTHIHWRRATPENVFWIYVYLFTIMSIRLTHIIVIFSLHDEMSLHYNLPHFIMKCAIIIILPTPSCNVSSLLSFPSIMKWVFIIIFTTPLWKVSSLSSSPLLNEMCTHYHIPHHIVKFCLHCHIPHSISTCVLTIIFPLYY